MMNLYVGTPGSGKSYNIARKLYHGLRLQRNFICNFPIDLDVISKNGKKKIGNFIYLKTYDMSPKYFMDYAKNNHVKGKEHQTVIIIDEASLLFNPQNWRNKELISWVEFMQLHRHIGYDIILITQNDRLINKQIRSFIENVIIHRKIGNYKLFGKLLGMFFHGNVFMAVEKWYALPRSPGMGSEMFFLNKKIARIYDTHMEFTDENEQNNSSITTQVDIQIDENTSKKKGCIVEVDCGA